jgi:hypothetical protein
MIYKINIRRWGDGLEGEEAFAEGILKGDVSLYH